MTLTRLAPNLRGLSAPLTALGMALGQRMTVARLPDGGESRQIDGALWEHPPVEFSPARAADLGKLGDVAHVVAPNAMHDT